MFKRSSLVAVSMSALLLTGCGSSTASTQEDSTSSPFPSDTPSTSETTTTPEAGGTPSADAALATAPAEESSNPSEPAEATKPSVSHTTEPEIVTSEPAVPPPANPTVMPVPTYGELQLVFPAGATFTVTGTGYVPGEKVSVGFFPDRSDYVIVSGEAVADANGSIGVQLTIPADVEPGSYGIMTVVLPDPGQPLDESSKRFASIEVVSP